VIKAGRNIPQSTSRDYLQRSQTLDRDLESPTMNCHREPTLNGILSDPIVRAVMEADGVNPLELAEQYARARALWGLTPN
jgi:hypothetical protein